MSDPFKAIADETRRQIIVGLSERPMAVHEIAEGFAVSRPAISKHLKILADAGIIRRRKHGRENVYDFEPGALQDVAVWLQGFWSSRLHVLKRLAEGD